MQKKEESKEKNKYTIDETEFIKLYKLFYELEFIGDDFYTKDGIKSFDEIASEIHNVIKIFIRIRIDSVVSSILKSLYRECYKKDKIDKNTIHTLNNKIIVKKGIVKLQKKETTSTRMNAEYLTEYQEPVKFLKFLRELLSEEDIIIFQEYLGYCFIPNTSAHKGLFIIGSCGDGKREIIGKTIQNLFSETITGGDLIGMLDDRFGLGNVINKLVNFDDELSDGYLSDSNNFKKLISGGMVRSEKKYKDAQLVEAFCRVIALGNHMIRIRNSADINAIRRRVLILETIPHSKDRKVIVNLFDRHIKKELNQIFMWGLEGLVRLQKNNWHFSFEEEMQDKVEEIFIENTLEQN